MILTFKNLSLLEKSFCLSVFFTWNFWAKNWHLEISKSPIIQKHVILEYSFHKIQMILHILKMQMQMTGKVLTTEGWKQGEIRGYCTKKTTKKCKKKLTRRTLRKNFGYLSPGAAQCHCLDVHRYSVNQIADQFGTKRRAKATCRSWVSVHPSPLCHWPSLD